jgi:hypothetical protein
VEGWFGGRGSGASSQVCQSREVRSAKCRNRCGRRLAFSVAASPPSALAGSSRTHSATPLHHNTSNSSALTHAQQHISTGGGMWCMVLSLNAASPALDNSFSPKSFSVPISCAFKLVGIFVTLQQRTDQIRYGMFFRRTLAPTCFQ